ncbi:hypothetical protein EVAR_93490_1 [Eumeta japonica]|uniref:Uncharacterized protein n=1 Tax=Eumeta variegata TaxID=151549 RepID=A0A4C1TJ97_EUMVA|nr:hypothetical protein EVAR_93490_1 [Eumeta japonica]
MPPLASDVSNNIFCWRFRTEFALALVIIAAVKRFIRPHTSTKALDTTDAAEQNSPDILFCVLPFLAGVLSAHYKVIVPGKTDKQRDRLTRAKVYTVAKLTPVQNAPALPVKYPTLTCGRKKQLATPITFRSSERDPIAHIPCPPCPHQLDALPLNTPFPPKRSVTNWRLV